MLLRSSAYPVPTRQAQAYTSPSATSLQVGRDVASVQTLCERLSACGDLAGQDVELAGRTVSVVKSTDAVIPEVWDSIAMIPVLEDANDSVRGLFKLRKPNSKSTVCPLTSTAAESETHLSNGVLKLRAESCIALDHTCTDFTLSDITVKGTSCEQPTIVCLYRISTISRF